MQIASSRPDWSLAAELKAGFNAEFVEAGALTEETDIPIRIVWAEKDRIIPWKHFGAALVERLPGADVVRLRGIGHVPMYDAPDEVGHPAHAVVETEFAQLPHPRQRDGRHRLGCAEPPEKWLSAI